MVPGQEEQPESPAEAVAAAPSAWTLAAGYSAWVSDFDFEASTPALRVEADPGSLHGFEVFGTYEFADDWLARAGVEFDFGLETDAIIVSLGGQYRISLLEEPWGTHVRAAALFATLDMEEVPGDFDNAFGFEAGVGASYSTAEVVEGSRIFVDLAVRHLEFDFDADSNVTDADDDVGGFGVRFLVGIDYRF